MNQLLIYPDELVSDTRAVISGARAAYVHEWHDLSPGITVAAGVLGGGRGHGQIESIAENEIALSFSVTSDQLPRLPIHLIVAIARPQTVKKVIHIATTLGITQLDFVRTNQTEKSYLDSKALLPEQIEIETVKGLEQACDTIPPQVHVHSRFKPFIEDVLTPELALHPNAIRWIGDTEANATPVSTETKFPAAFLTIGPEAGWTDYERERFSELGFHPISLGPRILRVETAATVLIARACTSMCTTT